MNQAPTSTPPGLQIQDLTVTLPNGHRLLDRASVTIKSGELVLLAGHSGSGKSTILSLIAGLHDDALTPDAGSIRTAAGGTARDQVGVVFQDHALFTEFSALENVQFAIDHRFDKHPSRSAEQLLRQLGVPLDTRLVNLSGGERQRVALARVLAHDAPLILFDEPTTGLDPSRALEVAELIAETHKASNKTTIIVTHDFSPFLQINPRIILIDETTGRLVDTDEDGLANHFRHSPTGRTMAERRDVTDGRADRWRNALEFPGEIIWLILTSLATAAGGWRHPRWKLRYLWHYARTVAIGSTAAYVAIAGAMLGFVFTSFSFSQLPYNQITLPLLAEEFLAATGYATYRVVVPLLTSVLIAGQCGASIAADVGTRRLTHQFQAAESLGAKPIHYWYGNIALALVVSGPFLVAVAFCTNWAAALVAFLISNENATVSMFTRNFMATVWPHQNAAPIGTVWVMAKAMASGLIIGAIAYWHGSRPKTAPTDVSNAVGSTIFWASLAVLALHSAVSFVEF